MTFTCTNKCGKQEVEWLFLSNAWLPVISVCNQNIGISTCATTCSDFKPSTYLWDACFTDYIAKSDNNVFMWSDLHANLELTPTESGKEPGFTVSTNGGTEYNVITFNGTNQGLGCTNCLNGTTAFTAAVVVNNLSNNLSENVGAIFSLLSFPFDQQILLGYQDGNIVLQYTAEGMIDIITPVSIDNGFHLIIVKYTGIEGIGNIEVIIDGNTYTNSSSFVFDNNVDTFYLGSSFADFSLNGEISWFAFYNSAISNGAVNNLINYATNKFNITLG